MKLLAHITVELSNIIQYIMKQKKVCILDTRSGNLLSLSNMVSFLGLRYLISNRNKDFKNSDFLIIPGVGTFSNVMNNLEKLTDIDSLNHEAQLVGKPILGICVGMQIMNRVGYENGKRNGLNWFPGAVRRFVGVSAPHVGWNEVQFSELLENYSGDFYFTHSYKVEDFSDKYTVGKTNHGINFVSAQKLDNILGVQFHPEKSQLNGLRLMKYFFSL